MTFEEFDKFSEDLLIKVRSMRDTKGKEYAGGSDRFDNFNRISNRMGITRELVWACYFTKHIDSIESYIRNGREFSDEKIQGRIVDAITYLTLLAGMLEENSHNKEPEVRAREMYGMQPYDRDRDNPFQVTQVTKA